MGFVQVVLVILVLVAIVNWVWKKINGPVTPTVNKVSMGYTLSNFSHIYCPHRSIRTTTSGRKPTF